ncbi:hypothetical protein, partial [Salmonella enterica]|uniref:hypothetical protein n=1 Tax=Salmonella enterica TaxID=28901 RepID=UPI003D283316
YDAMILLTRGENFGHAIFESFSVGVPVIISHFTPWHDLQKNKAGWNVEINDANAMVQLFNALAAKTQEEWKPYCDG